MKMRVTSLMLLLTCALAGAACVTVPYQPVYRPAPPPAPAPAPEPMPVADAEPTGAEDQPFYDDLAPYGQWVYASGPGWVWSPYDVPSGWRPYQLGHWVYTDYGWTWASEENFGWAVYHYGRWCNDPSYGWVWVPGVEWGPAWVAWHEGGGWIGWAPLPYQVQWHAGIGLDWGGVNINVALGSSSWHFVQAQYMTDPRVRFYVAPPSRNVTLVQVTHNVTNYTYVDNRIIDHSVNVQHIGKAMGRPVPQYRVRPSDSPGTSQGGRVRGEDFVVFRPNREPGMRSHGDPLPPGHDRTRPPGHDRPESEGVSPGQPNAPSNGTTPNGDSSRAGRPWGHSDRYPRGYEQRRGQPRDAGSEAGTGNPPSPPAAAPGGSGSAPGAAGRGNSATGSGQPAPDGKDSQGNRPPEAGQNSSRPAPDRPGRMNHSPGGPSQSGANPAASGQAKVPPAKGKGKKSGAAEKADPNKKDEPDKKNPNPDPPKPE